MAYLSMTNDDFTGGITDFPSLGSVNKYAELKNILITKSGINGDMPNAHNVPLNT